MLEKMPIYLYENISKLLSPKNYKNKTYTYQSDRILIYLRLDTFIFIWFVHFVDIY